MIQVFFFLTQRYPELLGRQRGKIAAPVRALIDALDFKVA